MSFMTEKCFVDTNIVIYTQSSDLIKFEKAIEILSNFPLIKCSGRK